MATDMRAAEQNLQAVVETLAAAVVLADHADHAALTELRAELQAVGELGERLGALDTADGARAAAAGLDKILSGASANPAEELVVVQRLVAFLQMETPPLPLPGATGAESVVVAAPRADDPPLDDALLAEFVQEAEEHLTRVDQELLILESDPHDDEALNGVFRAFHTIKGAAGFLGLGDIQRLAHEAENLLDRARKRSLVFAGPAVDVVFEAADLLRAMIVAHCTGPADGQPQPTAGLDELLTSIRIVTHAGPEVRLGELLTDAGALPAEAVERGIEAQEAAPIRRPLGEHLVEQGEISPRQVTQAVRAQKANRVAGAAAGEAVKVDAGRLDNLVDTIGELVIAATVVRQKIGHQSGWTNDDVSHFNHLDKITRELQSLGTSLRMVTVQPLFQKMARLVRDVAKKAERQVQLVTSGEDTELDKSVVDRLGDPLMHMLRNAVDHGLEPPAERVDLGKPEIGQVFLRAYHKGGYIYLEVGDDGRGLDPEKLRQKAVSRGVIRDDEQLSDQEIYQLIFEPGFSTASEVTDISGRGVGMDVVRRGVEELRGNIEISSALGRGTTFTLRLPLTLAVIDGMAVRVGGERYVIPTPSIVTTLQPTTETLQSVIGRGELLNVHGRLLPLYRLGHLFNLPDAADEAARCLAVVVEDGRNQVALLADELLGQQQIVIKSLGEGLQGIPGISGGAILADGRVGLILDVGGMIRLATAADAARVRPAA